MADEAAVLRLRLQKGDILVYETDLEDVDLQPVGQNLRLLLDRAGHAGVPIWLCSGGGKLKVISPAEAEDRG